MVTTSHEDGPWAKDGIVPRLQALIKAGKSFGQIAKILSFEFGVRLSKNAVISKSHRNGWSSPKAKKVKPSQVPRANKTPRDKIAIGIKPEPYLVRSDLPPAVARKTFLELGRDDCKWPVGDPGTPSFGFCAQVRVPGMPYCKECCARAYQAPVTRQKAKETEFA